MKWNIKLYTLKTKFKLTENEILYTCGKMSKSIYILGLLLCQKKKHWGFTTILGNTKSLLPHHMFGINYWKIQQ